MTELKITFDVAENLRPLVERRMTGSTLSDRRIRSLDVPTGPVHIRVMIMAIRCYQRILSPLVGNSCVFEPSCSCYAEMAIREFGLAVGSKKTVGRLLRCKPGGGGLDLTCLRKDKWSTR